MSRRAATSEPERNGWRTVALLGILSALVMAVTGHCNCYVTVNKGLSTQTAQPSLTRSEEDESAMELARSFFAEFEPDAGPPPTSTRKPAQVKRAPTAAKVH